MSFDVKKRIRTARNRSYLNKDFDSFRADLLTYARTYFPDRIKDFSDSSLGGLFLDLAASVGDVTAFYLDHQYGELNVETAVERKNIERHVRSAGVDVTGASPAVVDVTVYIEVPAEIVSGVSQPQASALPLISQGTVFRAKNGVTFELVEDLDFSTTDEDVLVATVQVSSTNSDGSPAAYILSMVGECVSGTLATQTFRISSTFVPFRTITLPQENVTEILSVKDSEGNTYYEVESLTQDVVFQAILNRGDDSDLVEENMELLPAPYRYTREVSVRTGLTTLRFGGGRAETLDDDIVPDPSELSIPLYGKKTFSRFSIDPGALLQTRTLGIAPVNTNIIVVYRHGGGLTHNVGAESIRSISKLLIRFPGNPSSSVSQAVRASLDVKNLDVAAGGESAPTLDELKEKVPAFRNAQSRIVTKEDLLARVYTMPSNFGRVFRAGVRSNPDNPLAAQLFIISRDSSNALVTSPDSLKNNLRTYLNQFRLISDAIDILDAQIINLGLEFQIAADVTANKSTVVQSVITDLKEYFNVKNFQIDQPIIISDVQNIIINNAGVMSLVSLTFKNLHGSVLERTYSDVSFNVDANTFKGLIIGNEGSIFEFKYPDDDIMGSAV